MNEAAGKRRGISKGIIILVVNVRTKPRSTMMIVSGMRGSTLDELKPSARCSYNSEAGRLRKPLGNCLGFMR